MKKIVIVTGGAGFVGTNLIKKLISNTKLKIISLDDYSSGFKRNHIKNKRVRYIKGHTRDISRLLDKYKNKNKCNFSFWRIF